LGGVSSRPTEGDSADWISQTGQICRACIEQAGSLYKRYHIGRLIKACCAVKLCS
jgi:hypothetical protein